MNETPIPLPDFLPSTVDEPPADLAEKVLALYGRLAEHERLVDCTIREGKKTQAAEQARSDRVIAALAAQRFELTRLSARLLPALAAAELADEGQAFALFARRFDQALAHAAVEVRDPTGDILDDELAAVLEVEGAVEEPLVEVPTVRRTLVPIVRFGGRVIGAGRVITSVPCNQSQSHPEEEEEER